MLRKTTAIGNMLRCANSSTQKCGTKRALETWLKFGRIFLFEKSGIVLEFCLMITTRLKREQGGGC